MSAPTSPCHCDPAITRALGRIEGRLDAIEREQSRASGALVTIDDRMDKHQVDVARSGGLYGAIAALGLTVLAESVKRGLGI